VRDFREFKNTIPKGSRPCGTRRGPFVWYQVRNTRAVCVHVRVPVCVCVCVRVCELTFGKIVFAGKIVLDGKIVFHTPYDV